MNTNIRSIKGQRLYYIHDPLGYDRFFMDLDLAEWWLARFSPWGSIEELG